MRSELAAYFSDKTRPTGLLVAEAPTGYGKTKPSTSTSKVAANPKFCL